MFPITFITVFLLCIVRSNAQTTDYLIFGQKWGGSIYQSLVNDTWTIGYFFAVDTLGDYSTDCGGITFDISVISDLTGTLSYAWPSQTTNELNEDLWTRSWTDEGDCMVPSIVDEHTYFQTAIDNYQNLDVAAMFGASGIFPDVTAQWVRDDYLQAITGPDVYLLCDNDGSDFYITDVVFCYQSDMNVM